MPNLGQNQQFFVLCDLQIWRMTLTNNNAPFLCFLKLCALFCSHRWIQTGVTVRKRPIWVKIAKRTNLPKSKFWKVITNCQMNIHVKMLILASNKLSNEHTCQNWIKYMHCLTIYIQPDLVRNVRWRWWHSAVIYVLIRKQHFRYGQITFWQTNVPVSFMPRFLNSWVCFRYGYVISVGC